MKQIEDWKKTKKQFNKVFSHDFTDFKKSVKSTTYDFYETIVKPKLGGYYNNQIVETKVIHKSEIKENLIEREGKWYPIIETYYTSGLDYIVIDFVNITQGSGWNNWHYAKITQYLAGTVNQVIETLKRIKSDWSDSKGYWVLRLDSWKVNYEHSFRGGLKIYGIKHDLENILRRLFQNYFWASGLGNDAKSWCYLPLLDELIHYLLKQEYDLDKLPYEEVIEYEQWEGSHFDGVRVDYSSIISKVINHLEKYETNR